MLHLYFFLLHFFDFVFSLLILLKFSENTSNKTKNMCHFLERGNQGVPASKACVNCGLVYKSYGGSLTLFYFWSLLHFTMMESRYKFEREENVIHQESHR